MRHFAATGLLLALFGLTAVTDAAVAQTGFERPGGDYISIQIRSGDPAACAAACDRDKRCRAWTFSYPTTVGTAAVCWLKDQVRPPVPNSCCVSGIRGSGVIEPRVGVIEYSTDRYGGDYRNFQMPLAAPVTVCQAACQAEGRCRAWTYLRPGYIGSVARCFLKDRITAPQRKPCCISGVVR
jgi:hypothetical protein